QVAVPPAEGVHARRAHARRRRRREARDLRADPLARGPGDGRAVDLLGARGGARPGPPRPGDARGTGRGRARPGHHERGGRAARGLRHRTRGGGLSMSDTSVIERLPARLRRLDLASLRDYGVVIAFVALFITLSLSSDVFLTTQNMKNLAFQTAPVGIIAVGGTLVFIA